ncbi:MAG: hypothetical protein LW823_03930 [Rickettsiales bacterium]|nr:hypothetical protein [Rickettsiales bacterium]
MKGYQRGFLEGSEEGKKQAHTEQADIERQLIENTEKLVRSVKPLIDDYRRMTLQVHEDVPKVALAVIKKLAGGILENNAEKIVSEMAMSCAQTMLGEPKLSINVHPSLAESLKDKLQGLAVKTQTATHFVVLRDESMALTDCRVEWKYGAMERHTGALWQEIERVVESMVASAKRDTDNQIQRLEQDLPKE